MLVVYSFGNSASLEDELYNQSLEDVVNNYCLENFYENYSVEDVVINYSLFITEMKTDRQTVVFANGQVVKFRENSRVNVCILGPHISLGDERYISDLRLSLMSCARLEKIIITTTFRKKKSRLIPRRGSNNIFANWDKHYLTDSVI